MHTSLYMILYKHCNVKVLLEGLLNQGLNCIEEKVSDILVHKRPQLGSYSSMHCFVLTTRITALTLSIVLTHHIKLIVASSQKYFLCNVKTLPVLASCSPTPLVPYPERKPRTGVPRHPYEPQASPGFKQFEIWRHEEEEQR